LLHIVLAIVHNSTLKFSLFLPQMHRFTSTQMSLFSHSWRWRLFWGLIDTALVNTFVLFRLREPKLTHAVFFKTLCEQLFEEACKPSSQSGSSRCSTRSQTSPVPAASAAAPSPAPEEVSTAHQPGNFKGVYKRSCYACIQEGNFKVAKARSDTGSGRKEYPKSYSGCVTCNVALCNNKGVCWANYHEKYCGENDGTDPNRERWDL
jgi:hypothetical protein